MYSGGQQQRRTHIHSVGQSMSRRDSNRSELLSNGEKRGECEVDMVGLEDQQLSDLQEKVLMIKKHSTLIEEDVREQNTFLDEMQTTLLQTTDSLKATTNRLSKLIEDGGGNAPLCYLVMFITFVFLVLYYLAKSSS
mmetsp:Transcript_424/g.647  ORF Transcript_424/g.647 Transcript_424/m.647 type:complete len:137 (-) Transcript_424:199-609(-)